MTRIECLPLPYVAFFRNLKYLSQKYFALHKKIPYPQPVCPQVMFQLAPSACSFVSHHKWVHANGMGNSNLFRKPINLLSLFNVVFYHLVILTNYWFQSQVSNDFSSPTRFKRTVKGKNMFSNSNQKVIVTYGRVCFLCVNISYILSGKLLLLSNNLLGSRITISRHHCIHGCHHLQKRECLLTLPHYMDHLFRHFLHYHHNYINYIRSACLNWSK